MAHPRGFDGEKDFLESGAPVYLHMVRKVHSEDPRDDCAKAHDKATNLDEEAHFDDLIAHAVQVGRDELVGVLNHVDEDLDLRLNLVEISRIRAQKQLHLFLSLLIMEQFDWIKEKYFDLLPILSVWMSEVETEHICIVPQKVSDHLTNQWEDIKYISKGNNSI